MNNDVKSAIDEFHSVVNMTPQELESWLKTEDSKAVGQKDGEEESTGHKSGKRIIELLHKKKDEYSEDDISHIKKVISYVHRHSAQQPSGDIEHTRWRYSLMNWGHDPLK
ncbi:MULTISPECIES: DUF3140 domain-containing protein [unclassified Coleofasciculus]|uniref:DUF3140 domain-containing protein n=1 Tax=Cyanophyceae TaxID=3028117 RepID=UPI001686B1A2|nr:MULTISPECIES: DUF3140 domain-containing protein [unclassified Coleofasciculus]MBD1896302.1 DUF3140 domain-containing protein [Coleofasciculus sp. FACHB-129]MBD2086391.1 DUF3140 domain-containing protein [Coleofasciculus sp. FACHB-542]